jgi:peptidyl-prolyl cis-trans isomerase C
MTKAPNMALLGHALTNMKLFLLLCLLAALAFGIACAQKKAPAQIEADLLAEVGPLKIRVADLVFEAERRSGGIDRVNQEALLEEMITNTALAAKAMELGLDNDAEVRRMYHNILAGKLRQMKLEPLLTQVETTDEEAHRHYEANIGRYVVPPRQRLAMLHLAVDRTMSEERRHSTRERLKAAREKALADRSSPGFGALAIDHSDDQASRYRGGEIGWIEPGRGSSRWDPAVIEAGAALTSPGDISPVIDAGNGFYLLKLIETQPGSTVPLDRVSTTISNRLLTEKRREIEQSFLEQTRASLPVRIHSEVLATLPKGSPHATLEPPPPSLP